MIYEHRWVSFMCCRRYNKKLEVILGRPPGICWWKCGLVTSPSWAPGPNTKKNEPFQHHGAVQLVLESGQCSSPALVAFPCAFEPGSKRFVAAHMDWQQHSLCFINKFSSITLWYMQDSQKWLILSEPASNEKHDQDELRNSLQGLLEFPSLFFLLCLEG